MRKITFDGFVPGQPVEMELELGGRARHAVSVGAWGVMRDYFPKTLAFEAMALRVAVLDFASRGAAERLVFGAPSAGRIADRGDGTVTLDLTGVAKAGAITLPYRAERAGLPAIEGLCSVTVRPASERQGWGAGWHYTFRVDEADAYVIEPGRIHRKVHVSTSGLSKAAIEAGHPTSNASAVFLRDSVVPPSLGGNGVLRYGEAPEVALDEQTGRLLWNAISGQSVAAHSNWLLFKRGEIFTNWSWGIAGARGESRLHPFLIGAYGTGEKPVIPFPDLSPGFSQRYVVQGIEGAEGKQPVLSQSSWVVVDDVKCHGEAAEVRTNASGHVAEAVTFRRLNFRDTAPPAPANGKVNWSEKGDRSSALFASGCDGMLFDKCFSDVAGWQEGYPDNGPNGVYPGSLPQPPTKYSHNLYISNSVGDGSDTGADPEPVQGLRDFTLRKSLLSRGALTGVQLRPGGIAYDNFFFRNNLAMFFGGGAKADEGVDVGNYSLALGNVITHAGQKTGQGNFEKALAIRTGAPDTVLLGNIIAHSGPANDGTSAWGAASGNELAINVDASIEQNGSLLYDDTLVRGWVTATNDQNITGMNISTLDATTVESWTDTRLGTSGSSYFNFIAEMRAEADPWGLVPNLLDHFRQGAGRDTTIRATPATVIFQPDARGITPGFRWDISADWSTGDQPGTAAGDTADLAGHVVHSFDTATLAALHLRGGTLRLTGGRITTGDIASGGTINLFGAGQVDTDGITSADLLTVRAADGRFLNRGSVAGPIDLRISGGAEAVLGYDSANLTIAAGRVLEIHGAQARVGFDGAAGGAATVTINGTLRLKSVLRIAFKGLTSDALGYSNRFERGMTITGATSGFTGTVADFEQLPAALVPGGLAGEVGLLTIEDWTGLPLAEEALVGRGTVALEPHDAATVVALVASHEVQSPLPPESSGRGAVGEFRSGLNGTAAPDLVSTIAIGAGSALEADLRGLAPGRYCLARADAITGGFGTVTLAGGDASLEYEAGKVVLEVV